MLKFFYGVMGSSKTAQALIQYYNAQRLTETFALLLKPSIDTRSTKVSSRIGLSSPCVIFSPTDKIQETGGLGPAFLIHPNIFLVIDEAQFCTAAQIDELRSMANQDRVNIYCYGLKTNFRSELFEGSKRLLEVADEIEEIPALCACGNKATQNGRFTKNILQTDGDEIQIGDTKYKPLCPICYERKRKQAARLSASTASTSAYFTKDETAKNT